MPLILVGLLGAAVGVGVYELFVRPMVVPATPPQPVSAPAPAAPATPFPGALGHLTPARASAQGLAEAAVAQAQQGRR